MNIMGMGIVEIGVVMLVAFLVLGPGRSIEMARKAGQMLGDLRRAFDDVTSAVSIEADQFSTPQNRKKESTAEPPPGVPVRPDTPSVEEEESEDTPSTAANSDSRPSESEDRG
ncbi:MAG: twin-arginine translocase TatA/TatE family subunit [Dehalococcoidia bacterium]